MIEEKLMVNASFPLAPEPEGLDVGGWGERLAHLFAWAYEHIAAHCHIPGFGFP